MMVCSAEDAYQRLKESPEWTSRVDLSHPGGVTIQYPPTPVVVAKGIWQTKVWIEEKMMLFSIDQFGNVLVTEKIGVPAGADD